MISDPFAIPEPGFEPYRGPLHDYDFSQPDLTPCTLGRWLRSDEVTEQLSPAQLKLEPRAASSRLGHIATFPN